MHYQFHSVFRINLSLSCNILVFAISGLQFPMVLFAILTDPIDGSGKSKMVACSHKVVLGCWCRNRHISACLQESNEILTAIFSGSGNWISANNVTQRDVE